MDDRVKKKREVASVENSGVEELQRDLTAGAIERELYNQSRELQSSSGT